MNFLRILHQQTMQLRWYFLASLALIMVLPLEEAVVNFVGGDGFFSSNLTSPALVLAPFLAGLIACANVQADFDDRRFLFWRSKPIKVRTFITLKFVTGLLLSAIVFCLPMLFSVVSLEIVKPRGLYTAPDRTLFASWLLISVMSYGLCFLANVLVRKTARAWLIGLTVTLFLLMIPFILPLDLKDAVVYFAYAASPAFIAAIVAVTALAFLFSLPAVKRNWHLRTNLKGLLWTGAGLVFVLALVFGRQIANIPILDQAAAPEAFMGNLYTAGDRIVAPGIAEVSILDDRQIRIQPMPSSTEPLFDQIQQIYPRQADSSDLRSQGGWTNSSVYKIGESVYTYSFDLHYRRIAVEEKQQNEYEKLYLRISQFEGGRLVPQSFIDFSEYIIDKDHPFNLIRCIEDKLVIIINKNILVGQIHQDGRLEIIEKKTGQLARYSPHYNPPSFEEAFSIPLVPVDQISTDERIRLSIDLNFSSWWGKFDRSLADISSDGIFFCRVTDRQIEKFKVIRWDDKKVWCRFVERRPFTVLETLLRNYNTDFYEFVKDDKLYVYGDSRLLVFDIRSGIRKLGHFERIADNCYISDAAVLDDGNILLSTTESIQRDKGKWESKHRLYLLENPE